MFSQDKSSTADITYCICPQCYSPENSWNLSCPSVGQSSWRISWTSRYGDSSGSWLTGTPWLLPLCPVWFGVHQLSLYPEHSDCPERLHLLGLSGPPQSAQKQTPLTCEGSPEIMKTRVSISCSGRVFKVNNDSDAGISKWFSTTEATF